MTTHQDQSQVPNGTCHCTITEMALNVSTPADLKTLIESDPAVRAFVEKVLANLKQANGQQREESIEAANADENKKEAEEKDATPAVDQFRTNNGKGKPVATPAAEDTPTESTRSSPSTPDAHAAATGTSAEPTAAPTTPTSTRNVSQQRAAAARPAVIPRAPLAAANARASSSSSSSSSSGTATRASTTVPTGVPKAECHDLLQYIGPASVHEGWNDGAHLPSRIPRKITSFIDDVRNCVGPLGTFDSLYYVEYHGGTWFFAAGLLAYLHRNWHRTNYVWNYDDYVVVRKDMQVKLLAATKAGRLHGVRVWDDKLAPGKDAGKGGNNGWPWTWFVRLDVYKERFAHAAGSCV